MFLGTQRKRAAFIAVAADHGEIKRRGQRCPVITKFLRHVFIVVFSLFLFSRALLLTLVSLLPLFKCFLFMFSSSLWWLIARAASLLIVVEMIAFGLFSFHLELEVSTSFAATPMCEFLS